MKNEIEWYESLISLPGSKTRLASWIISNLPAHHCYVEPFGGTATVLLHKKRPRLEYEEVYNDIKEDLVNFFKVLKNHPKELKKVINLPKSRKIFNTFKKKYKERDFEDNIERAGIYFYINRLSRHSGAFRTQRGKNRTSETLTYKRRVKELEKFSERLKEVTIEYLDYTKCIKKYDSPATVFYCDPPYLGKDLYEFEFTEKDHRELAGLLNKIKGKAIVSYYPHSLLEELYPREKWRYVTRKAKKSMGNGGMDETSTELLIMNYPEEDKWRRGRKKLDKFL